MFQSNDSFRFLSIPRSLSVGSSVDYRTEYSRDYARVLHSPSFRRLQSKTQLFPAQESDFFRNRLTHSLEVSQIAGSIARKLKVEHPELNVVPEVCEIAGLVHDIGHPPFGHNGEAALDECMLPYGGFEGNAQTLRILTRLEKKEKPSKIINKRTGEDTRVGLNLTARVIASSLKYDRKIPQSRNKAGIVKGYYCTEEKIVQKIKECLIEHPETLNDSFKTIECSIMDIADDIAYSTYDVEDAFKADFLTPFDMLAADDSIFRQIADKINKDKIGSPASIEDCRTILIGAFTDVFDDTIDKQKALPKDKESFATDTLSNILLSYNKSKRLSSDGYYRTEWTSRMVNDAINGIHVDINSKCPILSHVYLDEDTWLRVNVLKHFSYVALINSSRLKVAESRGFEIIKKMFDKLYNDGGHVLLPEDTKLLFNMSEDHLWKTRVICDFIAGMTDRYALEFYGRLFSETPQTIFKPL